jgi:hypothetical protein
MVYVHVQHKYITQFQDVNLQLDKLVTLISLRVIQEILSPVEVQVVAAVVEDILPDIVEIEYLVHLLEKNVMLSEPHGVYLVRLSDSRIQEPIQLQISG